MKYLHFSNEGEIDLRALTVLGLSTKRDDDSKIGKFGSGLKYGLAVLLRNNIDVRIFSGLDEISIRLEREYFKDVYYDRINIDGVSTSFTTSMGHEWEVWMAIREIYCNAIDEGLIYYEQTDELKASVGDTNIYIEINNDVLEVIRNWDQYFAFERRAVWHNKDVRILEKEEPSSIRVYRKGILCYTDDRKSIYDYDFTDVDINESRIAMMPESFKRAIWNNIFICSDEDVVFKLIGQHSNIENLKDTYEWAIPYWTKISNNPNNVFKSLVNNKRVMYYSTYDSLSEKELIDSFILPDAIYNSVKEHVSFVSWGSSIGYKQYDVDTFYREIEGVQEHKKRLANFKGFLTRNGIGLSKDLSVIRTNKTLYVLYGNKIYINESKINSSNEVLLKEIYEARREYLVDKKAHDWHHDYINHRGVIFLEFLKKKVL